MTKEERAAASDILKYIQTHPQAKHTAEGIAKYWISQQRLEEKLETVLAAIGYLVRAGFVTEVEKADKGSYYQLNQEQLDDVPQAIRMLEKGNTQ